MCIDAETEVLVRLFPCGLCGACGLRAGCRSAAATRPVAFRLCAVPCLRLGVAGDGHAELISLGGSPLRHHVVLLRHLLRPLNILSRGAAFPEALRQRLEPQAGSGGELVRFKLRLAVLVGAPGLLYLEPELLFLELELLGDVLRAHRHVFRRCHTLSRQRPAPFAEHTGRIVHSGLLLRREGLAVIKRQQCPDDVRAVTLGGSGSQKVSEELLGLHPGFLSQRPFLRSLRLPRRHCRTSRGLYRRVSLRHGRRPRGKQHRRLPPGHPDLRGDRRRSGQRRKRAGRYRLRSRGRRRACRRGRIERLQNLIEKRVEGRYRSLRRCGLGHDRTGGCRSSRSALQCGLRKQSLLRPRLRQEVAHADCRLYLRIPSLICQNLGKPLVGGGVTVQVREHSAGRFVTRLIAAEPRASRSPVLILQPGARVGYVFRKLGDLSVFRQLVALYEQFTRGADVSVTGELDDSFVGDLYFAVGVSLLLARLPVFYFSVFQLCPALVLEPVLPPLEHPDARSR